MKAVYWQRGESLDYLNGTGADIPANTVVIFGNRIGVAGTDIPAGENGTLHVVGVFEFPKKTGVSLAMGDPVTFTEENGMDKATSGAMGYVIEDAAAEASTVRVKLLG
ncbi:DUF2190 family protein [Lachnospiraceae bacterium 45-P1]